jgi:hypothetical protein
MATGGTSRRQWAQTDAAAGIADKQCGHDRRAPACRDSNGGWSRTTTSAGRKKNNPKSQ